jgi:16S rRNA (cytosine1402-N4)-methyltransferase
MDIPATGHDPVLLDEVLSLLQPRARQTFIDCTMGRAGHAAAIALRLGADGLLVGLDVDPRNLEYSRSRLADAPCRVRLFHANFAELEDVFDGIGNPEIHGILADLGLSTNQFSDPRYGLSFALDTPLDMRLDPRLSENAADLVNSLPEKDLADVLYRCAQERYSRRIARKIVEARRASPIVTTERLAELVRSSIPARHGSRAQQKIDPATRTFLALRMRVNREMENLEAFLEQAPRVLARGGRLGVISFQSMEDRQVKQAFRSMEQTGFLRVLTKKPLVPTDREIAANPRSRSARLRVAEKI